MGYYTNYELTIQGTGERWVTGVDAQLNKVRVNIGVDHDEVKKELVEIVGYNPFEDSCKWYDNDVNMREISRRYPDLLFVLTGQGEEPNDMWRCYHKAGKRQREQAKVEYGAFDPALLK